MGTGSIRGRRTAAAAVLAAAIAFLAFGAGTARATPAATLQPTNTCWLDVVNDWLDHNGDIQGTYAPACYTQAIQHLDQYPDVKNYSNADEDIHRALLAALHQDRGDGPGSGSAVVVVPGPGGQGGGTGTSGDKSGVINRVANALTPGSAQSVPLPLIVLGALALLLLLAALGTWLARRMQARRPPGPPRPATAPATPRPRRP